MVWTFEWIFPSTVAGAARLASQTPAPLNRPLNRHARAFGLFVQTGYAPAQPAKQRLFSSRSIQNHPRAFQTAKKLIPNEKNWLPKAKKALPDDEKALPDDEKDLRHDKMEFQND